MRKAQTIAAADIKVLPGYVIKNGRRHYLLPRVSAKMRELRKKQRAEQERNNDIFAAKFLSPLLKTHRGQVAVMKKGAVSGIYSSIDEATAAAERRYPSCVYSIHNIEEPVEYEFGMGPCVIC